MNSLSKPSKFPCFIILIVLLFFSQIISGAQNDFVSALSLAQLESELMNDEDPFSMDALFGDEQSEAGSFPRVFGWRGFSQLELAHTYPEPEHFSKARIRTHFSQSGQLNPYAKWKISARFDYDAIHDLSDFYPKPVRQDQGFELFVRENFLDISAGDFDVRIGRQHIVWGEMVGLFFADVVSAKDMREFVLPDFDIIRIPQWAIRTEYSKGDFHADLIWIPFPSLDETGKPGAEFFPFKPPGEASFLSEDRSGRNPSNSNYGLRLSQIINGWDIAAFYYHSLDATPTFYRISGPTDPLIFQARHDKIDQFGGTMAKSFSSIVLRGELVYTNGRKFNVTRLAEPNGLTRQDTLDYTFGIDFLLPAETRLNLQAFQRVFFDHDPDIVQDKWESGASVLLNGKIWQDVEVEGLLIHSLNRNDWMFRPKLSWNFKRNWRLRLGADVFNGQSVGLFGRFDNNDRIYTELRYSF